MDSLNRLYIKAMRPIMSNVAKFIGPIHAPFSHKNIDFDDVIIAQQLMEPGDAILDRTNGELTTAVIPGFWKHAILYIGNGRVIEAVGEGVRENWLANVMMKTDNCVCLRKRGGFTPEQKAKVVNAGKRRIGWHYNYEMDTTSPNTVYCSELIMDTWDEALGYEYFELQNRMGFLTITPDDCYNAKGKMEILWEKKDY